MPRPSNNRLVYEPPLFTEFKPVGVAVKSLRRNSLTLDEYEAVRLADQLGLSHEEAADEIQISRSTFSRLVAVARAKITDLPGKWKNAHNRRWKCAFQEQYYPMHELRKFI